MKFQFKIVSLTGTETTESSLAEASRLSSQTTPQTRKAGTQSRDAAEVTDRKIKISLEGTLGRQDLAKLWRATSSYLSRKDSSSSSSTVLQLHCSALKDADSFGIAYFLECERSARANKLVLEISDLSKELREKLKYHRYKEIAPASEGDLADWKKDSLTVLNVLRSLGNYFTGRLEQGLQRICFLGELMKSIADVILGRQKFRRQDMIDVMHQMGVKGLIVILVIGFMVGIVLSFQTLIALRQFGTDLFVVNAVSVAIFRGFGPFVTAILVAGRTGSSFAAELGAMKKNEEIYALRTMGISPVVFLVLPRVLAMTMITPLLNVFFVCFSMVGLGMVMLSSGMPLDIFLVQLQDAIGLNSVLITLIKPIFFGTFIAFAGCYRGIFCDSDSRAIGKATTNSMVDSLIGIIFLDGIYSAVIFVFNL